MGATIAKPDDGLIEPPQESQMANGPARVKIALAPQHLPPIEGNPDPHRWAKVGRELEQNWSASDALSVFAKSHSDRASVSGVLRKIAELLQPLSQAIGREIELDVCEHTAARVLDDDLRAAIRALLESSLAQGSGRVRVVSRPDDEPRSNGFILIEVLNDGRDLPDTVRRKLSKAVIDHAGETSFISARAESRVRIRLPMAKSIAGDGCPKSASREPATAAEHFGFDRRSTWTTSEISEYVPRF